VKHDLRAHALTIATIVAGGAAFIVVPLVLGILYIKLGIIPSQPGLSGYVVIWGAGWVVTAIASVFFAGLAILVEMLHQLYAVVYTYYQRRYGETFSDKWRDEERGESE